MDHKLKCYSIGRFACVGWRVVVVVVVAQTADGQVSLAGFYYIPAADSPIYSPQAR